MRYLIFAAAVLAATPAFADSVTHASGAVTASGQAVGNLAASGIETVVGVAALPLGVVGAGSQVVGGVAQAGGESVGGAGKDVTTAAEKGIENAWGPLSVDNRVVVHADPAPIVPFKAQRPAGR